MKRSQILSAIALIAIASCGKSTPPSPEIEPGLPELSPDSTWVRMNVIHLGEQPLTKGGSSDDLYGVNIYSGPRDPEKQQENYYAYGVFDNLADVMVKLSKHSYYMFEVVYIPRGKKVIYKYPDGHYGTPFDASYNVNGPLNQFMYSKDSEPILWELQYGISQGVGHSDRGVRENMFNTIDRYQGVFYNFDPIAESSVSVDLYRVMTGIKLIADDFTEGKVCVGTDYGIKHYVSPAANSSTNVLEVVVEMPFIYVEADNHRGIAHETSRPLVIYYTAPDGNELKLYQNDRFTFKRNVMHVIQFSLSDAIRNGTIVPNIVNDGEMREEIAEL